MEAVVKSDRANEGTGSASSGRNRVRLGSALPGAVWRNASMVERVGLFRT